ncbi:MAG: DHH family phosphoesterase [Deltaproteobacteria bacterium]|nr:DHH family phosphoesterase [Deltaproteobacteria bacterium]
MPTFNLKATLERVRGLHSALVLMHDNPDPDAMAAAECMRHVLEQAAGLSVTVAQGGIIGRAENRAMVATLGLVHVSVEQVDFSAYPVIALVDTQPETGNNSLPSGHRVDIVVDHHPPRAASHRAPWCDIRAGYGASCTITYSYLKELGIPTDSALATAILYALKSETRDLIREASEHEVEAYTSLMKLADFDKLRVIAEPKVPAAHFAALDRALRAAEVRGPLLAVNLGSLDYPDLVAEIADLLLPFEGAHFVLCVGTYRGAVHLSVRTDLPRAHAGDLTRKMVGARGTAGGHGACAGGRLRAVVTKDDALVPIYRSLVDDMAHRLRITAEGSVPLLQSVR